MATLETMADDLGRLSLQIKHDLEQAESKVEQANVLVQQAGRAGLFSTDTIFGDSFQRRDEKSPLELNEVVSAALLIPEGFGVCIWNEEAQGKLDYSADGLHPHARQVFRPFERCSVAEKVFLLPFVEEMLEDIGDLVLAAAAKRDPGGAMPAQGYFAARKAARP